LGNAPFESGNEVLFAPAVLLIFLPFLCWRPHGWRKQFDAIENSRKALAGFPAEMVINS